MSMLDSIDLAKNQNVPWCLYNAVCTFSWLNLLGYTSMEVKPDADFLIIVSSLMWVISSVYAIISNEDNNIMSGVEIWLVCTIMHIGIIGAAINITFAFLGG